MRHGFEKRIRVQCVDLITARDIFKIAYINKPYYDLSDANIFPQFFCQWVPNLALYYS